MRALSVWNPWAWALVMGLKPVENRGTPSKKSGALWKTQRDVWTLIQVGTHRPSRMDIVSVRLLAAERGVEMPEWVTEQPINGHVIGAVRFVDDKRPHEIKDPWARRWVNPLAAHCWVVGEAVAFKGSYQQTGSRGFFDVTDDVLQGAREELEQACRLAGS